MDEIVRDAVMMGAAAIQPMVTTRAEVTLASVTRSRRCERWERIAIAAAKQSGRAVVPAILEPRAFADVVQALGHLALPGPGLMFVEPSAASGALALSEMTDPPPRETTIVIGPEGGWDPGELDRGAAACRLVTLGGRTLRADAMPVIALAALFARWNEY
jgi:16S rRNA (uracil1498-N3)-methyltransferase